MEVSILPQVLIVFEVLQPDFSGSVQMFFFLPPKFGVSIVMGIPISMDGLHGQSQLFLWMTEDTPMT
jgi:hypothetical protein